ncbi:hypothetical protein N7520_011137 [Penicillium odoratum]|uniref:uncharacterized protein n=1 Tax=Penicillium odoratum TaxID=1167516 RepID=UPI0025472B63|nr:uncharacterized protein N7520_011137 [Penicillium odoratum]KAJ5745955.1 hypothetical protein N7520_011137 [Penicillium odoratum]
MWNQLGAVLLFASVPVYGTSDTSNPLTQGNSTSPWPNSVYSNGTDTSNPVVAAGSKSNQTSPPWYPSPWGEGLGDWEAAYARARSIVSQMTLPEKINLTTGVGWELERCVGQNGAIPRLGIPSMCMQDSPTGVRDTDYNSVFPMGVNVAATWDRGMAYARGQGMGYEHKHKGSTVQLGPVVGPLGRVPEGGRNWEGFAPDPVLSGVLFGETISGIQSQNVVACGKHFIGYEQEHFRTTGDYAEYHVNEAYSANIDDVTMHEMYLWPWMDGVRAGMGSVMCAYNQINNSYACQNSYMLNKLLKAELGFQGFVMSDWSAQMSGVSSALAGLDMTMPGDIAFDSGTSYWGSNLTVAVLNGTVPQWRVDDMAVRIMAAWYYVGVEQNYVPINFASWTLDTYGYEHYVANEGYGLINEHVDVRNNHGALIREIGAASAVLLKNVDALPLTGKEKFTGVFGSDAGPNAYGPNGCSDRGCDMGTLGCAWGSGSSNFPYLITPSFAIENEINNNGDGIYQAVLDDYAYSQIESVAAQSSVAIVFVNSNSGEGYITVDNNIGDRNNLTLWHDGDALIKAVSSVCNNTIVVIHSVGAVLMDSFVNNDNVTAIIWAGVPGEESGNSIADVLYGRVNPGGKLPFTMGSSRKDYGADVLYNPNSGQSAPQLDFTEGQFIDYRAFDKGDVTPIYEFGYGKSYTTFSYSDITITKHNAGKYTPTTGSTSAAPVLGHVSDHSSAYTFPDNITPVPYFIYPYLNSTSLKKSADESDYGSSDFIPANALNGSPQPRLPSSGVGGNPLLWDVLYTVTATIANTGKIAGDEVAQLYVGLGGPNDVIRQLRGFERLRIAPGEAATFTVDLTRRDLSNWDTVSQDWFISDYDKTIYVGASSRNLPLKETISDASGFN